MKFLQYVASDTSAKIEKRNNNPGIPAIKTFALSFFLFEFENLTINFWDENFDVIKPKIFLPLTTKVVPVLVLRAGFRL